MGCYPLSTHPYNSHSGYCSDKYYSDVDVRQKVQYIAYKVDLDEDDCYLFFIVYFPRLREAVGVTLCFQKITSVSVLNPYYPVGYWLLARELQSHDVAGFYLSGIQILSPESVAVA